MYQYCIVPISCRSQYATKMGENMKDIYVSNCIKLDIMAYFFYSNSTSTNQFGII